MFCLVVSKKHFLTQKRIYMGSVYSRFTDLKKVDYHRPETKPIYLGQVVETLSKTYAKISTNFIDWFGASLEEMPGPQYYLGYGESKFEFTYGEANLLFTENFGKKPSLMQILLMAKINQQKLTSPKAPLVCFIEDKYKQRNCLVQIYRDSIDIAVVPDEYKILPRLGYIFGSPESNFLDEKEFVPRKERFTNCIPTK